MSDERSELIAALGARRDAELARLLTVVIGIAAETHPEELRRALASVMPAVDRVEEDAKRIAHDVFLVRQDFINVKDGIVELELELSTMTENARIELRELRSEIRAARETTIKVRKWLLQHAVPHMQKKPSGSSTSNSGTPGQPQG